MRTLIRWVGALLGWTISAILGLLFLLVCVKLALWGVSFN